MFHVINSFMVSFKGFGYSGLLRRKRVFGPLLRRYFSAEQVAYDRCKCMCCWLKGLGEEGRQKFLPFEKRRTGGGRSVLLTICHC